MRKNVEDYEQGYKDGKEDGIETSAKVYFIILLVLIGVVIFFLESIVQERWENFEHSNYSAGSYIYCANDISNH